MHARIAKCLFAVLLTVGCGPSDPDAEAPETFEEACAKVAGCETPENAIPGPVEPIWRVLVVREDDGTVRIDEIDEVDVPEALGPPPGALDGDLAIAGLDADSKPVELRILRFADVIRTETIDGTATDELAESSSAIGYLRALPEVSRIAVVESDGTEVDGIDAPEPGASELRSAGRRSQQLLPAAAGTACSHVMLLEGPAVDSIWDSRPGRNNTPLMPMYPVARATIQAALGRLTPIHCAGVSRDRRRGQRACRRRGRS